MTHPSEYTAACIEPTTDVPAARPDTIGFYAMPVMANLQNTGNRLQTMVDALGIPFVMSDLLAQNRKTVFGYSAKQANRVSGSIYRDMSRRRLDYVHEQIDSYGASTVLAMGDSLGVPVVQGMQLHGDPQQRFDALLLRDGWNLKSHIGTIRGLGRYGIYQLQDMVQSRHRKLPDGIVDHGYADRNLDAPNETNPVQKLLNVADIMRGAENRQNALLLAAKTATATEAVLHLVCLRNGLSGSEDDAGYFLRRATVMYKQAAAGESSLQQAHSRLRTSLEAGWHSDLLRPDPAAEDVRSTLALL